VGTTATEMCRLGLLPCSEIGVGESPQGHPIIRYSGKLKCAQEVLDAVQIVVIFMLIIGRGLRHRLHGVPDDVWSAASSAIRLNPGRQRLGARGFDEGWTIVLECRSDSLRNV
jgi:hypothetical protein